MPSPEDLNIAAEALEQARELRAKIEANKPRAIELDPYDQLLIDNILWREKAARASQELAARDFSDAANIRNELIKKLKAKHKLDADWQIVIDQVRKTAIAEHK